MLLLPYHEQPTGGGAPGEDRGARAPTWEQPGLVQGTAAIKCVSEQLVPATRGGEGGGTETPAHLPGELPGLAGQAAIKRVVEQLVPASLGGGGQGA